ncbi:MAG: isocyanide synthase family protein [Proteobacteria bacterium]|nr:isocyanide synthase family protein [Pseudomonadota bacterium]
MRSLEFTFPTSLELGADTPRELAQAEQVDLKFATDLAKDILRDVMQFRRIVDSGTSCAASSCHVCLAPHLQKVVSAITQGKPIPFVLPAFPGKSPNPAKVLGPLPDMAERRALHFLNYLCDRVRQLYPPGAQIILCSDGRVFSDIIGMSEDDVTAYQHELDEMIEELDLANISTFTLDESCEENDFVQVRHKLMERYGKPLESLREMVRRGGRGADNKDDGESHRIYCGITRFLVEDSMIPGQTRSRSSIQRDCRVRAYEVIRRSNAWSELIAERFPNAVRLSIHPQTCGARKLGIQLLGTESWMTPWHGVVVDTGKGFILMKRWEAEKLTAQLVRDSAGRASHYRLHNKVDAIVVREYLNEF